MAATEREYVMTVDGLRKVAIGSLGPMTGDSYRGFMEKARALGARLGVAKPIIVLDIKFKPGRHPFGLREYPYPAIEQEWGELVATLDLCDGIPEVRVADGSKYSFPIFPI